MTEAQRIKWIRHLQCSMGDLAVDLGKALSYGNCPEKRLKNNTILGFMLNTLYRYEALEDDLEYAYSFDFSAVPTIDAYTVELVIGPHTIGTMSCDGDETAEDIAYYFYQIINAGSYNPAIYAEYSEDTLYVYSYDATVDDTNPDYEVNITLTSNDTSKVDVTVSTFESDTLLDMWNCLTEEQLCNIIKFMKTLLDRRCNC